MTEVWCTVERYAYQVKDGRYRSIHEILNILIGIYNAAKKQKASYKLVDINQKYSQAECKVNSY